MRRLARYLFTISSAIVLALGCSRMPMPVSGLPAGGTNSGSGGWYYVSGHVDRPGAYRVPDKPITLNQALRRTGPDPAVRRLGLTLFRRDDAGESQSYVVGPSSRSMLLRAGDELNYGTNFVTRCFVPPRKPIRLP